MAGERTEYPAGFPLRHLEPVKPHPRPDRGGYTTSSIAPPRFEVAGDLTAYLKNDLRMWIRTLSVLGQTDGVSNSTIDSISVDLGSVVEAIADWLETGKLPHVADYPRDLNLVSVAQALLAAEPALCDSEVPTVRVLLDASQRRVTP